MIYVDGQSQSWIPADDPGLLLGLTAFETMRSYGRAVFRLEQHLERLLGSARELEIALPPLEDMAAEIRMHAGADSAIRYTVTAGGRRILQVDPLDRRRVGAPIRLFGVAWEPSSWLPGVVKHGSRASWVLAARHYGVDEVLLVDRAGLMLEASRSNIVGVKADVLVTPPLDGRQLAGVTLGALFDAARQAGLELRQAPMPVAEPWDELYCASTLKELAPVTELNGGPGPGGGPVGAALHAAFRRLVEAETGGEPEPQPGRSG